MAGKEHITGRCLPRGLKILYEDRDILVVDKPAGLLTMGTGPHALKTASHLLTEYLRQGRLKSKDRIFVVHRLDQWTSGVLVFAKSEEIMLKMKDQWPDTEKKYVAVVHGQMAEKEGVITSYLVEDREYVVHSTPDASKGKLARTAYKVLKESKQHSLLDISLLTGRKNQIRVHMADQGHPVVGDRKYGKTGDGCERLALHSRLLSFKHPVSGERMSFESPVPQFFQELIGHHPVKRR